MHVTNLSIRHLKQKIDEVRIMLDLSNYIDIFEVCETFLNPSINDSTVHVDEYNFERNDRHENPLSVVSKGGGVLIYIADHINYYDGIKTAMKNRDKKKVKKLETA